MRTGFATGSDPNASVRDMAAWTKRAEDRGYQIGFFSETIELMRERNAGRGGQQGERFRDAGGRLPILRPAARHQTERLMDMFAPG